jgi:pyruvate formate lyase activating enzyme
MFGDRGGVTFGGGEATLQADDLLKTLRLLHAGKINTAVESNASTETFAKVAQIVDYLICDLKAVSDKIHIKMTGISNRLILDNLNKIALTKKALLIRIPIISGLNDGSTEMGETVNFLADLHRRRGAALKLPLQVELLRMHHLGKTKYEGLGIPYPMSKTKLPDKAIVTEYSRQLSDSGIEIVTS